MRPFLFLACTAGFFLNPAESYAGIEIDFMNSQFLYKEGNKYHQKVLAQFNSEDSGKICFYKGEELLLSADYTRGRNRFLVPVPAVSNPEEIQISVIVDKNPERFYRLEIVPPSTWSIYLVQQSHTDIGYTRPQSEILAEHLRYIDWVLDYCDQTDGYPDDAKFRWTCESAWITREYLRTRPFSQVERLKKRIGEGRIEVTGMHCNLSEMSDENSQYDFVHILKDIEDAGIRVITAMQNDIHGVAWCIPDYYRNTGIRYLSVGSNWTRSLLLFDKPTCFWWESPSGARILSFRSDHYMKGNHLGLITNTDFSENLTEYLSDLESKNYPFNRITIQFSGYRADNSAPSITACEMVRKWNEKYANPRLKLATASEFPAYVEANYGWQLPVYRKPWLDWWSDGFGSASRETAEIRKNQNRKQVAEGLFSMVGALGGKIDPSVEKKSEHISDNILFYNEHTFGYKESISNPFSENTLIHWLQKSSFAWESSKRISLLNEEALGQFEVFLKKGKTPVIHVINTLGWNRSGIVQMYIYRDIFPPDSGLKITDLATGKQVHACLEMSRPEGAYWSLEVKDVPAMGCKAFAIELDHKKSVSVNPTDSNVGSMENRYYKLTVDTITGALSSLFDKEFNQELVDRQNQWNIGQLIRETISDRDKMDQISKGMLPERDKFTPGYTTIRNVKIRKGNCHPFWESVLVHSAMSVSDPELVNKNQELITEIRLYKNAKKLELKYSLKKQIITSPEALYVAFPFELTQSRIVFETIGGVLTPGQQLPGSSSDWNVVQNFVSVRSKKGQVIIVSNEIPLWHFGGLNTGKFERYPKSGKTWLYSWVMNNYWYTNFRAYQEGAFSWSYQITSSPDTTNSHAARFALGERIPFTYRVLPAGTVKLKDSLLETIRIDASPNVLMVNCRPVFSVGKKVLLHFREMDGKMAEALVSSSEAAHPVRNIFEVNLTGRKISPPVSSVRLNPYEVKFIEIEF